MSSHRDQFHYIRGRFGGALLGIALRSILPQNELTDDSRDVVKLGVGLIATMAALVLGLLIASAKSSLDTQNSELTEMSSRIVLVDRVLAHYGPEAKQVRDELHSSVLRSFEWVSSKDPADPFQSARLPKAKFCTIIFRGSRRRTILNARSKRKR